MRPLVGMWQKVTKSDFQVNFLSQKLSKLFKKYNDLAKSLAPLGHSTTHITLMYIVKKKEPRKNMEASFLVTIERINKPHTQTCLLWCKNSTFHKKGALLPLTCI